MSKNGIKKCVWIVLVLIGFGSMAISNRTAKENEKTMVKSVLECANADTLKEGFYVALSDDTARIQLEYPSMISYLEIKKFDILISYYPANAVYCKISSDLGKTSLSKLYLKQGNQISYYFPDHLDNFIVDTVSLAFYDENQKLMEDHKISIAFDKDAEQFEIFEIERL